MPTMHDLREFFLPSIEPEVERYLDKACIQSIRNVTLAIFVVEALLLLGILVFERPIGEHLVSSGNVLFCSISCFVATLLARHMIKADEFDHRFVSIFEVAYFALMSAWGISVSFRHYMIGEQILTFFTVELIMVCFLTARPWLGSLLMGGAYGALFALVYGFDGAAQLDNVNYVMFAIVSIVGMSARFQAQRRDAQRAVELRHISMHDRLTDLRNRQALDEDAIDFVGHDLAVRMIDINYFKEVNDRYGHLVGDLVLKATATQLAQLYPNARIYRFGGDEFLVVGQQSEVSSASDDTHRFEAQREDGAAIAVMLGIGTATGTPTSHKEFYDLVDQADRELYLVKVRTHDPANGGIERRRRR